MGKFDDLFRQSRNYKERGKVEYYEDTHNERGEYMGAGNAPQRQNINQYNQPAYRQDVPAESAQAQPPRKVEGQPLPDYKSGVAARNYQNVVVYEPKTPDDVQTLIDYLKRREPAIVNLESVEPADAQRILDFVSGAIYALNGSVHRIAGNIFLLSPEGVEITIPYEQN